MAEANSSNHGSGALYHVHLVLLRAARGDVHVRGLPGEEVTVAVLDDDMLDEEDDQRRGDEEHEDVLGSPVLCGQ